MDTSSLTKGERRELKKQKKMGVHGKGIGIVIGNAITKSIEGTNAKRKGKASKGKKVGGRTSS